MKHSARPARRPSSYTDFLITVAVNFDHRIVAAIFGTLAHGDHSDH